MLKLEVYQHSDWPPLSPTALPEASEVKSVGPSLPFYTQDFVIELYPKRLDEKRDFDRRKGLIDRYERTNTRLNSACWRYFDEPMLNGRSLAQILLELDPKSREHLGVMFSLIKRGLYRINRRAIL